MNLKSNGCPQRYCRTFESTRVGGIVWLRQSRADAKPPPLLLVIRKVVEDRFARLRVVRVHRRLRGRAHRLAVTCSLEHGTTAAADVAAKPHTLSAERPPQPPKRVVDPNDAN